jgi:hypothetical protein
LVTRERASADKVSHTRFLQGIIKCINGTMKNNISTKNKSGIRSDQLPFRFKLISRPGIRIKTSNDIHIQGVSYNIQTAIIKAL